MATQCRDSHTHQPSVSAPHQPCIYLGGSYTTGNTRMEGSTLALVVNRARPHLPSPGKIHTSGGFDMRLESATHFGHGYIRGECRSYNDLSPSGVAVRSGPVPVRRLVDVTVTVV